MYEASNYGAIRSLPRRSTRGHVLKQHRNQANGYLYVTLCKNGTRKSARVHKLIYEAFTGDLCDGYNKDRTINHIDGDKTNNSIENLERISQRENQIHALSHGLQKVGGIKVICLDTMEIFVNLTAAAKSVGGNLGEMVARVCRGERSHYRGHVYAFYNDYINGTIPEFKGQFKKKASVELWR